MTKLLSIVFVGWIGYQLGNADMRLRLAVTAFTILGAGVFHSGVQYILPHAAIEKFAASVHNWPPAMVPVALLETAGMLVPALVMPWTAMRMRLLVCGYLAGAATMGALAHYYPFETIIMNDEIVEPGPHPSYEGALLAALTFAIVPFLCGLVGKRRRHRMAGQPEGSPL